MSETNSTNVIIVQFQYSVVANGIGKKLSELKLNVASVVGDIEKLKGYTQKESIYIVYLPDEIADDKLELSTFAGICQTIINNNRNMILIGEKRYHNELIQKLPFLNKYKWLDRPIDLNLIGQIVKDEINNTSDTGEKKKILIVDDDPSYARMVREWIKDSYNVGIVTAGMQAITYLMKNKVDLILLDYEMPVVDGPQVLQMLRQEPELEKIPVVFLTGVGTREGVARVLELKPNGYILKSTTREDLLNSLKAQFDKMK